MASMVSGTMPAYLKVPVSFPSTSEYDEDIEGDGEGEESLENLDWNGVFEWKEYNMLFI